MYDWGFHGHKLINEYAVYALPSPLRSIFIQHAGFLKAHSVDADKRRYAVKTESFQHYFDYESWQDIIEIEGRPTRREMISQSPSIFYTERSDTHWITSAEKDTTLLRTIPTYYCGDEWDYGDRVLTDTMASHGLLPITIINRYFRLVSSFKEKDLDKVLKYAADLGHYVGDAHVPLHTSKNYNGQLSGQVGIHAFWETSIPELLASEEFDLVVGRADYIADVHTFAWDIVIESHKLVGVVLSSEKKVRDSIDNRKELCPINRNGTTVFSHCPEFTKAYHEKMDGMVEMQMNKAIKAVADLWWSAYVDAGQPSMGHSNEMEIVYTKDTIKIGTDRSSNRRCQ
jgi:hypothetical protein